jgi:isopentenyl diphosphate isomerase/L-lactate dehydrogenase-like FMN-dependent dehydrogenase
MTLYAYLHICLHCLVMVDITNIESSLPTTILGHNFSAPFFIAPCARAGYAHPDAELNFVKGAASGDILYMVSLFGSRSTSRTILPRRKSSSSASRSSDPRRSSLQRTPLPTETGTAPSATALGPRTARTAT